jgi:hypothetical protein
VLQGGRGLHLLHKTPLEGIPAAMCAFQDKLLVGMGSVLRLYDLGKKKLLRKCELRSLPTMITTLHSLGDRIYGTCYHHWAAFRFPIHQGSDWGFCRLEFSLGTAV